MSLDRPQYFDDLIIGGARGLFGRALNLRRRGLLRLFNGLKDLARQSDSQRRRPVLEPGKYFCQFDHFRSVHWSTRIRRIENGRLGNLYAALGFRDQFTNKGLGPPVIADLA